MKEILIIGAGGLGREIAATLQHPFFIDKFSVKGFIDDQKERGTLVNDFPVLGNLEWLKSTQNNYNVVLGIGNIAVREKILEELKFYALEYPTVLHPNASIHQSDFCKIGHGNYIAEGTIITTNVSIGNHCVINVGCSLHHDTIIEDNCILMPGARITGGATIRKHTFVGANTAITIATEIAPYSVL